eukprot:1370033-Rhodomonas_salina.1
MISKSRTGSTLPAPAPSPRGPASQSGRGSGAPVLDVGDVGVLEEAHHVHQAVHPCDVRQERVPQPQPLRRPLHQPRDVLPPVTRALVSSRGAEQELGARAGARAGADGDGEVRRDFAARRVQLAQPLEPLVRHRHLAPLPAPLSPRRAPSKARHERGAGGGWGRRGSGRGRWCRRDSSPRAPPCCTAR